MKTTQAYITDEVWFEAYFQNKGQKPLTQAEFNEIKREAYGEVDEYKEKQELPQYHDITIITF